MPQTKLTKARAVVQPDVDNEGEFALAVQRLGSPATAELSTVLTGLNREHGTATFSFLAKPSWANMLGNVQGGFVAAMLDEAAGITARLLSDEPLVVPTLDFNVRFVSPVRIGPVLAIGRCLRVGKRVAFLEADIVDRGNKLLSRMTLTALASRER